MRNSSPPQVNILLIIVAIVVLGLTGIAASSKNAPVVASPTITPPPMNMPGFAQTSLTQENKDTLQLQTFSPAPTQTPATTSATVDFSSPSLDWDDVGAIFYYTGLPSLSSTCTAELNAAVQNEDGEQYPPHPGPRQYPPNSRVGLCLDNASCKKYGYAAYNGTTPLPVSVPDAACRTEIGNAYQNAIAKPHPVYLGNYWNEFVNELYPPIFPNCDVTDDICP